MTSSKSNGPRPVPPPSGGGAKPSSSYSRFIPREELAGFASWTPDAFAGALSREGGFNPSSAARAAAADRRQSAERRNMPDAPPAPPPEPTAAEWQARAQAARQQGYQEGYRDGLEALEAAKRQYAAQITAQMAQVVAAFDEQIQALEVRMASHLRLRMNPQDLTLIEQGAGAALRARDVIMQADAAISAGGCVVESDLGQVDARIESRWAQAMTVFGAHKPWHEMPAPEVAEPALPDPMQPEDAE